MFESWRESQRFARETEMKRSANGERAQICLFENFRELNSGLSLLKRASKLNITEFTGASQKIDFF